jgi:hypothetical protein
VNTMPIASSDMISSKPNPLGQTLLVWLDCLDHDRVDDDMILSSLFNVIQVVIDTTTRTHACRRCQSGLSTRLLVAVTAAARVAKFRSRVVGHDRSG